MVTTTQRCATAGCPNFAAYHTKTRPAWCTGCLEGILANAGLRSLEPFPGKATQWWLAACLACEEKAHFRLVTVLDKNESDEPACRACFWKAWVPSAGYGMPVTAQELRDRIAQSGYVANVPIEAPAFSHDTVSVTCPRCKRIQPRLIRDMMFGCDCSKNTRTKHPTDRASAAGQLLRESGSAALQWWDHDANDEIVFETTKTLGRKLVHWRCPQCGHRFEAKSCDMQAEPHCPPCEHRRSSEWKTEYEKRKRTPVSDVPELRLAWISSIDPSTVMVGDHQMYNFRCSEGHQPKVSPSRYLDAGCPACSVQRQPDSEASAYGF